MIRSSLLFAVLTFICCLANPTQANESTTPFLRVAHSHNDYHQAKPLTAAREHGFSSIEADVFLVEGQLLVGHERSELRPGRTLQSLYLDPLRKRVESRQGWVYEKDQPVTLLVDFKSSGAETYAALKQVLLDYREMLSSVKDNEYQQRAVEIVISGNRPHAEVAADAERYAFIDGRINELTDETPRDLVPLVSENWNKFFKWRGQGPMPAEEKAKLRQLVQQMHKDRRRLRFWATPETPAFWTELRKAKVDVIGTDKLGALWDYLLNAEEEK